MIVEGSPSAVTLITPANNVVIGISSPTTFSWTSDPNADQYKLYLIRSGGGGNIYTTSGTSIDAGAPPLVAPETYTWYVESINTSCSATGVFSATRNFTTAASSLSNSDSPMTVCRETSTTYEVGFVDGPVVGPASLSLQSTDLPGSVMINFSPSTVSSSNTFDVNLSNIVGVSAGTYNITVLATGSSGSETIDLTLEVESDDVSNVVPVDGQEIMIDGSGNGLVSFSWDAVPGATKYTLYFNDGAFFFDAGTNTSQGLNFGPVNDGNIISFNIEATTGGGNVTSCNNFFTFVTLLPVEWLAFSAKAEQEHSLLDWEVIQDGQGESYTVERQQADNPHFIDLATIEDNRLTGTTSYSYTDKTVKAGQTYYYRLRQRDVDGAISYSPIREVKFNQDFPHGEPFKLAPNPSSNRTSIVLSDDLDAVSYHVYGTFGQLLLEGPLTGRETELDLSHLPAAVYQVVLSGPSYHSVQKLVKH